MAAWDAGVVFVYFMMPKNALRIFLSNLPSDSLSSPPPVQGFIG
jgi:hypothetical protein